MIMSSDTIALDERSPLTRELAILPQPMNPIFGLFERSVLSLICYSMLRWWWIIVIVTVMMKRRRLRIILSELIDEYDWH